ncbi:MAG: c-type cytochrome [Verrucomicrobiae bacterium]|nr:c-type cytochrome [Verrucomicrobiae bacterium]
MKFPVSPAITLGLIFVTTAAPLLAEEKEAPQGLTPVPRVEAYDSWKMAKPGDPSTVTPPTTIQAPEGFAIDLIRAAGPDEDSWIGMCFDDRGRAYLGMEQKGILRLTFSDNGAEVVAADVVEETLEECRGLLWAHGALYANANDSKGFYRLRDTTGDDRFDEVKLLLATGGGVGHGRNHLRLGPDGMIYLVHGNDPWLDPKDEAPDSPFKNWGEDQLILNPWDDSWNRIPAPAGYILRTDKDGSKFERLCGGLRNALDMDFNRDGEMFVYDADSEWDAGLAWYKPTRVLHIVSGGEYGWRRGTGKWPAYYPDSLPAACDIGLGSPTGVGFAYESDFPEKWREAFFIADWSYGRLLAIHLTPDGASYTGEKETFLSGRPLNLTAFAFHDGALWFITGGRRTQSALYRVRWTGEIDAPKWEAPAPDPEAKKLRELRHELERWHTKTGDAGTRLALANLDHPERFIRFAARVALENQPVAEWRRQVLGKRSPTGLLALARVDDAAQQGELLDAACEAIKEGQVDDPTLLTLLRAIQLSFIRQGEPNDSTRAKMIATLDSLYPGEARPVNHELCELLVYLGATGMIGRTLGLLESSDDTRDWSHYLVFLRYIEDGWNTDQRRRYLEALRRFETWPGGRWWIRTGEDLRKEAVAALTEEERTALADLLEPAKPEIPQPEISLYPAKFVQNWTLDDFATELSQPLGNRDLESGKRAYHAAACVACHRMASDPATNQAVIGPDLSGIGGRFDPKAMLESIIHPSRVIADLYRNPAGPNVSPMPPSLINVLSKDQVLDLLAYLQADKQVN